MTEAKPKVGNNEQLDPANATSQPEHTAGDGHAHEADNGATPAAVAGTAVETDEDDGEVAEDTDNEDEVDDKRVQEDEEQEGGEEEEDEDEEEAEDEDEDEDDEDENDDDDDDEEDDDEPRLKYARLTQHLGAVYRNGDSTSAFLVAGDKMIIGTHKGNVVMTPELPPGWATRPAPRC